MKAKGKKQQRAKSREQRVTPCPMPPAQNGFIFCQSANRSIDQALCAIQGFRYPKGCRGCRYANNS